MKTTTGRTSEPEPVYRHTSVLVEQHKLVRPILDDNVNDVVAQCRERAVAWAEAHGLELFDINSISSSDQTAGVVFSVDVGHGDIDLDQRAPGTLDRWRWSARMLWWRKVLSGKDGRQGRVLTQREEGRADVIDIGHPDFAKRAVTVPYSAVAATEEADAVDASLARHLGGKRRRAQVGTGCSCALGGPFVEMCPVHYREHQ